MKAFVFTDKALSGEAGRFVWLELNTEKAGNAALRRKLAVNALPSFFIVDPDSEKVILRRVGGMTTPQLLAMLDAGRHALSGAPTGPADQLVRQADERYGNADYAGAARGYIGALAAAPAGWPAFERVTEALLFALAQTGENEKTAVLARDSFPRLKNSASSANLAASGLDAALDLPKDNPSRAALLADLEADARAVVADPGLPVAADDRSSVYISLLSARDSAGDTAGAAAVARDWAAFLEKAAADAPNPDARAVFDPHRLSAYIELGHPERAIPMLEASERDLPDDYNPPARLAVAYRAMKRWDDALAASTRALAKAYGPRQLGILSTRSDIQAAQGDTVGARATLEYALKVADALPAEQRSEGALSSLKKKLANLNH